MLKLLGMIAFSAFLISTAASADDNEKWISKCIVDNVDEGQTSEVVKKYCTCMNYKMDENETRSVTEWEKTHESEMKACEKESGWK